MPLGDPVTFPCKFYLASEVCCGHRDPKTWHMRNGWTCVNCIIMGMKECRHYGCCNNPNCQKTMDESQDWTDELCFSCKTLAENGTPCQVLVEKQAVVDDWNRWYSYQRWKLEEKAKQDAISGGGNSGGAGGTSGRAGGNGGSAGGTSRHGGGGTSGRAGGNGGSAGGTSRHGGGGTSGRAGGNGGSAGGTSRHGGGGTSGRAGGNGGSAGGTSRHGGGNGGLGGRSSGYGGGNSGRGRR